MACLHSNIGKRAVLWQMHAFGGRLRELGLDEKWLLKSAKVEIRKQVPRPWVSLLFDGQC